jgi:GDSL-like lipase/acylhydrolase family protein
VLIFLGKLGVLIAIGVSLLVWGSSRLFGTARAKDLMGKLALLLTSVMIAVVVGEFVVRAALSAITTTGDNSSYFARRWVSGHVRLNSSGFREREFEFTKPQGRYRIAVIGDSYTFGQGIEEAERFSNLLERELSREHRGVEVLNFGRAGYNTIDEVEVLRETVLKAQPDFVLLQWTVNDFEGHMQSERPSLMRLIPSSTLEPLLHRRSALFYLINQQWQSFQYSWGLIESEGSYYRRHFGDPNSPRSRVYRQELTTLIDVSGKAGVPLAILLFPFGGELDTVYPFGFLHERVLEICSEKGIPCIDLRPNLAPYAQRGEFRKLIVNRFDGHPSAFANRIAADVLLERFRDTWVSGMTNRASHDPRHRSRGPTGRGDNELDRFGFTAATIGLSMRQTSYRRDLRPVSRRPLSTAPTVRGTV